MAPPVVPHLKNITRLNLFLCSGEKNEYEAEQNGCGKYEISFWSWNLSGPHSTSMNFARTISSLMVYYGLR